MNYVFININYLLKNKVIWCVKLKKFVNVKNISGVNVVLANKAWLSPFKWSNYPVNTTTCFRKRYLNWTHLRVIIKRKKRPNLLRSVLRVVAGMKILLLHWKGIVDRQMFWICFTLLHGIKLKKKFLPRKKWFNNTYFHK